MIKAGSLCFFKEAKGEIGQNDVIILKSTEKKGKPLVRTIIDVSKEEVKNGSKVYFVGPYKDANKKILGKVFMFQGRILF